MLSLLLGGTIGGETLEGKPDQKEGKGGFKRRGQGLDTCRKGQKSPGFRSDFQGRLWAGEDRAATGESPRMGLVGNFLVSAAWISEHGKKGE